MATRIPTEQIQNLQQLEAVVAGPDGANRLLIVNGQLPTNLNTYSQGPFAQQQQTFTVLLGPVLTRQQFFRAVSTASLTSTTFYIRTANSDSSCNWQIVNADADWDDESGQVELRIEVSVGISGSNNNAQIASLGFNVSILASLPA